MSKCSGQSCTMVGASSAVASAHTVSSHAAADANLDRIQTFIESHTDAVLAGFTAEKLEFDEALTF